MMKSIALMTLVTFVFILLGCTQPPATTMTLCEISSSDGTLQTKTCAEITIGVALASCETNQENQLFKVENNYETLLASCPQLKNGVPVTVLSNGNYKITAKGTTPAAWTKIVTSSSNNNDNGNNNPNPESDDLSRWCKESEKKPTFSFSSSGFSWNGIVEPKDKLHEIEAECYTAYGVCALKLSANSEDNKQSLIVAVAIPPLDGNNAGSGPSTGEFRYTVDNYNWGNQTLRGLINAQPQSLGDLTKLGQLVALHRVMLFSNKNQPMDEFLPAAFFFPIKRRCEMKEKTTPEGVPYQVNQCTPAWSTAEDNSPIEGASPELLPCYATLTPSPSGKKGLFDGTFSCDLEALGTKNVMMDGKVIDQEHYTQSDHVSGTFSDVCFSH